MIVPNAAAACPYRVGDYLFSENATHPSTSWPGTSWVQVQGRTILGAGEDYPVGSEGGEAQHTLTEDEMPAHIHDKIVSTNNVSALTRGFGAYTEMSSGTNGYGPWFGSGFNYQGIAQTNEAGGGQAHNNLPPYRAAYIWRRTA